LAGAASVTRAVIPVGGILLVFADWCGRMVLFPYQIPAGLLSTFIGAPYFIYLLRKQSR
jgi:iron complex transport system permease protein